MAQFASHVLSFWHRKSIFTYVLLPFSWLFQLICIVRRWYYSRNRQQDFQVPIIIVGNISLGGTGKTPLVGWLVHFLQNQGFNPGIVMRGYGGQGKLIAVNSLSDAKVVGDEALLLVRKCNCPIVIGRDRTQAVKTLLAQSPQVDLVICDDGLQHYALERDLEIAVIDGKRRFGNGYCLPAGPLRESPQRLKQVDFVVTNGEPHKDEWEMTTALSSKAYRVSQSEHGRSLDDFRGQTVHAVAGIGNPERFFLMLQAKGINIIKHCFDDHHFFSGSDLRFQDNLPILMTEKDAVKCSSFAPSEAWFIPLEVHMPEAFSILLLRRINSGQKIAGHSGLPHLQATSSL